MSHRNCKDNYTCVGVAKSMDQSVVVINFLHLTVYTRILFKACIKLKSSLIKDSREMEFNQQGGTIVVVESA